MDGTEVPNSFFSAIFSPRRWVYRTVSSLFAMPLTNMLECIDPSYTFIIVAAYGFDVETPMAENGKAPCV